MSRTPVWKSIAASIEDDISSGHYGPGDKLATEAALAARFGVNRHTVRRALGDMAARGIVRTRRGSGIFVETPPTEYPIGRRVRYHANIAATGRLPEKRVLRVETRPCDATEADALAIAPGDKVTVYEGLSLADGAPIAHFQSSFPTAMLPDLANALRAHSSVTLALKAHGVEDYTRRETRLTAELASATQALHLNLREGDPLLKSISINVDPTGRPIERGITWFAGERVALTILPD